MYIIDQGENELVNLDKMTNIAVTSDEDERWFVVAYNVYGASYNLGYYADKNKAKAALYDIYQQMNTNAKTLYAPD